MEKWKFRVVLKEVKNRMDIANEYIRGCTRLLDEAENLPEVQICDGRRVPPGADVVMGECPHCGVDACFCGTTDWLHRCAVCKKEYFVKVATDA